MSKVEVIPRPGMFSQYNPALQVVWDKTSLWALQFCARRYQLEILEGYRRSSVDLVFGSLFAGAANVFLRALLASKHKPFAQLEALKYALNASGERVKAPDGTETWVPWGGLYEDRWSCSGSEPYRNEKGNRAKCPHAKAGVSYPLPAPNKCGTCGSPTVIETQYVPEDPYKNRRSLIRLVLWYTEQHSDLGDSTGFRPFYLGDDTCFPSSELSFRIPLADWKTPYGEQYVLAGHIDALKRHGTKGSEEVFVVENKTTTKSLGAQFFDGYDPSLDVEIYDLATHVLYPSLEHSGVLIEGAQILKEGANFGVHVARRTDAQREEFINELHYWIKQAEDYAARGHWPMRHSACWLCPFKGVCRLEPQIRKMKLNTDFARQGWDTTRER